MVCRREREAAPSGDERLRTSWRGEEMVQNMECKYPCQQGDKKEQNVYQASGYLTRETGASKLVLTDAIGMCPLL